MVTDEQVLDAVERCSTKSEAARQLGIHRSTLINRLGRLQSKDKTYPTKRNPQLTREDLQQALLPPNNCAVAAFRGKLDHESLVVLDEALSYQQRDFPSSKLRDLLLRAGFSNDQVPGVDALNAHRAGRRPCRCKG